MSKKARVISLICALVFILILMNQYSPAKTLDARIYYTYAESLEYIWKLTPAEQSGYAIAEGLDFLLIATYTVILLMWFQFVFPWARWFLMFAFLPGFFDLIETGTIFLALVTGSSDYLFEYLGTITCLKWLTGCAVVFLSLGVLSRRGTREMTS